MNQSNLLVVAALFASLTASGCTDSTTPTGPEMNRGGIPNGGPKSNQVLMEDECDPASFNAAIGSGTCTRQGRVIFSKFIDQLTKHGYAVAWRNQPDHLASQLNATITAVNVGGEVHTFTHVAAFGGGIVPLLNQLSHNPVVAPECNALEPDDIVAPGGTYLEDLDQPGLQRFQCCIHPWMRATVQVSAP